MNLKERIQAFEALGERMHSIEEADKAQLFHHAANFSAWFTATECERAWQGVMSFLAKGQLERWTKPYTLNPAEPKEVGVVMAGNLPMVGFHDLLCVLISGNRLVAKLSSQDSVLIKYLVNQLCDVEPRFIELIHFRERMNDVHAVIATGSDNTSRYFEYYFRNKPHIIRKNRSSCAVLTGSETRADFEALGSDVFSYFGLGCRNVSKLFVPEGYNFSPLLDSWQRYEAVSNHHKYVNNYDYNKSILLVNSVPFLDNGFVLITENAALVSPISVVYYETYKGDPGEKLKASDEKIQCLAIRNSVLTDHTENEIVRVIRAIREPVFFGSTQQPRLSDYADNIDTLKFLEKL